MANWAQFRHFNLGLSGIVAGQVLSENCVSKKVLSYIKSIV